jgi:hypothetical protein
MIALEYLIKQGNAYESGLRDTAELSRRRLCVTYPIHAVDEAGGK